MSKLTQRRVLVSGVLSPLLALVFYSLAYGALTSLSPDREKDWSLRLSVSTLMLTLPFFVTLALAIRDRRRHTLSLSGKVGLALAVLSLGLAWQPVSDGITRSKQVHNLALHDVPAPPFDTSDISGVRQRLEDQRGKVVLVNIWATWCGPCKSEMPKLDRLYRERKDHGFIVFGLSDEDVALQRKFLQSTAVTYPLLTVHGKVPSLYRDIARYPAIFLVDRGGNLQPAPGPDQPFEKVEGAVEALLRGGP